MAMAAGIIRVVVGFYHFDSDTAFDRHRSRLPISDDQQSVVSLIAFLGIKELSEKYGLGSLIWSFIEWQKARVARQNIAITLPQMDNRCLTEVRNLLIAFNTLIIPKRFVCGNPGLLAFNILVTWFSVVLSLEQGTEIGLLVWNRVATQLSVDRTVSTKYSVNSKTTLHLN